MTADQAKAYGLNLVGLKRKGASRETIEALKRCYTLVFRSKLRLEEALDQAEQELGQVDEVRYFVEFARGSQRGICR